MRHTSFVGKGTGAPALRAGVRYCRWLTRRARSHFSLSFLFLPIAQRHAMEAVYAFCRAVDDVVDDTSAFSVQRSASSAKVELNRWRRELQACAAGVPTHPIAVALEPVIRRFEIPMAFFERIIAGVEMDLAGRRYASFEELKLYCERVASAVGLISVRIFGCAHPEADRYATSLGVAFQLTNILRDFRADAQAGRIYLPQDEMLRFGCRENDLVGDSITPALQRLLAFQCVRAHGYFSEAAQARRATGEGRKLLPARIMEAVYGRLLERIERSGDELLAERISIPRVEQAAIALRCLAGLS